MTDESGAEPEGTYSSERAKAFVDASVAIALTLLILPLMESVSELHDDASVGEWFRDEHVRVMMFVLSFTLIAMVWLLHHRLFASVERVTSPLLVRTLAWVLTVVWLPVATALIGAADGDDPIAKLTYIGTLVLTCLASLSVRLYLRRHPELHTADRDVIVRGIIVDVVMAVLYLAALIVSVTHPAVGYFALFLLALTGPGVTIASRIFKVDEQPHVR